MRRTWQPVVARDGTSLATETTTWGESPRPMVIASHATGFCKEVFHPCVDELRLLAPSAEVVLFDHRAHGDSDAIPPPYDWWDLGRDVLAVTGARRPVVGLGHSAGAAALIMAELLAPGTFQSLVLVEPIVFPGPYDRIADHPLVDAALKRRRVFEDADRVYENFADKPPFASWDPRALAAYVYGGFVPGVGGWRLKCPPESEADFYRGASAHGAWERLADLGCDVTLVAGEHSDTHPGDFLDITAQRLGTDHVQVVPGASHFVVMEAPGRIAAHVAEHLEA